MSEKRRDLGALWHALVGAALGAIIAFGGWLREKMQQHDPNEEMGRHKRIEAGAWAIGVILGAAGVGLWVWLA